MLVTRKEKQIWKRLKEILEVSMYNNMTIYFKVWRTQKGSY